MLSALTLLVLAFSSFAYGQEDAPWRAIKRVGADRLIAAEDVARQAVNKWHLNQV